MTYLSEFSTAHGNLVEGGKQLQQTKHGPCRSGWVHGMVVHVLTLIIVIAILSILRSSTRKNTNSVRPVSTNIGYICTRQEVRTGGMVLPPPGNSLWVLGG